ncbi:MAG TPA: hypothetical protein VMT04_03730 [Terriglobales bacterium]|nr:hypothetical protein [Terriglobales bacterium]
MKGKILWGIVLLIILSISIIYFNCTKSVTRYFPSSIFLYAGNTSGYPHYNIYVISTETDLVVDSITLDASPILFSVSPNKRTLYADLLEWDTAAHTSNVINCEIDTRTKRFKYIGPNTSTVVSPDGRYLFKGAGQGSLYEFHIFDAFTHQQVYSESISFQPDCFDRKTPLLYGHTLNFDIKVFNYKLMKWVKTFYPHYPDGTKITTGNIALSPDSKKLYFLSYANQFFIGVYDIQNDSLLTIAFITNGGPLNMTPDGRYIYVTDPGEGGGCGSTGLPPSGEISVYSTETNTALPNIDTQAFEDTVYHQPLPTIWMAITPDSRKGYVSTCRDRIIVLDLIRNEAVNAIIWPSPRNLSLFYIAL